MENGGDIRPELELGKRIQKFRKQRGLTQQGLCFKAHLSYSTLAKIERGAIRSPSVFTIEAIAIALSMSIDEIVGIKLADNINKPADRNLKKSKAGIRFVYFDVNGCLVRFYQRAFSKIADDYGISSDRVEAAFWNYNDRINKGRLSVPEFNSLLARKIGIDQVDWLSYYLSAAQEVPGMNELLSWVADNYNIGLLTNIMPGVLDQLSKLKKIPQLKYDVIIDSSVEGLIKPEYKIFELASSRAHVAPEEILLVDDTKTNLIAASKKGWHIFWFDYSEPAESIRNIRKLLEFN